jgi:hypothetical protein
MYRDHGFLYCALVILSSACGLGAGAIVPVGSYTATHSSGGGCTGISGRAVQCGGRFETSRSSSNVDLEYETETSFGTQLIFRRGIGSASSADQSASGMAYDLGLEFILHGEHLSYGIEIGLTRQDLSDFAEDYRYSAFYVMPRLQRSFGRLALYGGVGYLGMGTLDLPVGFGQEASSVRFAGGLRIGIPVQLGFLDAFVLGAEAQRTQALDDIDYASNALLGSVTVVVAM